MTQTTKTILWIAIPTVVVTGILIVLIRKNKNTPDPNGPGKLADATGPTAPRPTPAAAPSNSAFPLKQGSRNDYVKKLQTALKITADGIFGPNTENALKAFAGITIVKDEVELNSIIKKGASATNTATNSARADDLLGRFYSGLYAIQGLTTSKWTGVTEDTYGALQPTGQTITLYKGTTYNNSDYKIVKTTKLGNVIIEVTRGTIKGLWSGDPNTISLVKYTPPPLTRVFDDEPNLGD